MALCGAGDLSKSLAAKSEAKNGQKSRQFGDTVIGCWLLSLKQIGNPALKVNRGGSGESLGPLSGAPHVRICGASYHFLLFPIAAHRYLG